MPKLLSVLFLFLLQAQLLQAQTAIVYSGERGRMDIEKGLYIFSDETGTLPFDSVVRYSKKFVHQDQKVPNLGITNNVHWIRFDIENQSSQENLLLEFVQPNIQQVSLFHEDNGQVKEVEMGSSLNYDQRKYDHQNFIFDLDIKKGSANRYYLRLKSNSPIMLPLVLGTKDAILEFLMIRDMYFGIYFGVILVMLFYNLFIFFSVRDLSYLIYVLYILVVGVIQASLGGYSFKLFFSNSPWIVNQSLVILPALGGMLAIEFLKIFTHTKELIPRMHRFFIVPHVLFAACIVLSLTGLNIMASKFIQPAAMIASLYIMLAAIALIKKGSRPAKFFLTAWGIFLIGIFIFVLKDIGILPYNKLTVHILEIGSALEVILLSIGLADRINIFRKEKEESQAQALSALRENERIIKEQNIILEKKVKERTNQLEKVNSDLNNALVNLKDAQSQLVSAEKMASLGQLTAGIAHEINNPINFVTSNIEPLKQNINEILMLVDKYEVLAKQKKEELGDLIKEVEAYKKEVDLNYVIEETTEIINGIKEGAHRTEEIVRGLRNFSHLDDIGIKVVDINEGISSTLNLLKGELARGIDIQLELNNIKELECYGGKINQVFMNVINNSIQAVKAKENGTGKITIRTEDLKEGVKISIIDEGIGMDSETKERIFDPFFTTKDVGQGTGLGLSIVYGIIESHHGTVSVQSELQKGTTFIINLPYKQPN